VFAYVFRAFTRGVSKHWIHVQDEIEQHLQGELIVWGTFAFSRSYAAPIPLLTLAGLGTVGLPLSAREAAHVVMHCVTRGEKSGWEMDASNVACHNPAWSAWLRRAVQDACKALGVDYEASKPKPILHKLHLGEVGSQSVH
jgi:hypothetical protein